jgi:hypothetical protein
VPESGPEVSASKGPEVSASKAPEVSASKGPEVSGSVTNKSVSASEYNKENVKMFFNNNVNTSMFSDFVDNKDNKKFKENMNYLKIAESVVRNEIIEYGVERCQMLMGDAAVYAWSIIESSTDIEDDKQFSQILTAFEILHVVDPSNKDLKESEKKEKIDTINKKINEKINGKKFTDINETTIESKAPKYQDNTKLTGYTPIIVDQGGSGNCFYYSVWGGLKDLGQDKYNEIVTKLTEFTKTLKTDSDVDFADTINDKEKFNINIRKLLAYCFLANTNDTFYESYRDYSVDTLPVGKQLVDYLMRFPFH